MINATSSGVIPFRFTRGKIEYLLLKGRTGDWEFPKGGIESDEEYQQTAIRELKEEADIEKLKLYPEFKESYDYIFYANNEKIYKEVHLFIGQVFENDVNLSKEHSDYQWRTYDLAHKTLTHDAIKDILDNAHEHIQNHILIENQ